MKSPADATNVLPELGPEWRDPEYTHPLVPGRVYLLWSPLMGGDCFTFKVLPDGSWLGPRGAEYSALSEVVRQCHPDCPLEFY